MAASDWGPQRSLEEEASFRQMVSRRAAAAAEVCAAQQMSAPQERQPLPLVKVEARSFRLCFLDLVGTTLKQGTTEAEIGLSLLSQYFVSFISSPPPPASSRDSPGSPSPGSPSRCLPSGPSSEVFEMQAASFELVIGWMRSLKRLPSSTRHLVLHLFAAWMATCPDRFLLLTLNHDAAADVLAFWVTHSGAIKSLEDKIIFVLAISRLLRALSGPSSSSPAPISSPYSASSACTLLSSGPRSILSSFPNSPFAAPASLSDSTIASPASSLPSSACSSVSPLTPSHSSSSPSASSSWFGWLLRMLAHHAPLLQELQAKRDAEGDNSSDCSWTDEEDDEAADSEEDADSEQELEDDQDVQTSRSVENILKKLRGSLEEDSEDGDDQFEEITGASDTIGAQAADQDKDKDDAVGDGEQTNPCVSARAARAANREAKKKETAHEPCYSSSEDEYDPDKDHS
eukprot:GHVT01006360.1.p1 GENE.GHVT01006360.1~~GHVT01006360.1.p1  ORF type:complete len:491 (-),score=160.47 GHVT01006360.1:1047-2420(-)